MANQPGLNVKVKQTGFFKPANLDNGQLTRIGSIMVAAQKQRWAKAIDADGNPAKPLSKKYFFIKRKVTGQNNPKRDMNLQGVLVKNFQLRKAIDQVIRAENTTRLDRSKAQRCQTYEQMIGFSGTDQIAVFDAALAQYGQAMKTAFVPIVTP